MRCPAFDGIEPRHERRDQRRLRTRGAGRRSPGHRAPLPRALARAMSSACLVSTWRFDGQTYIYEWLMKRGFFGATTLATE